MDNDDKARQSDDMVVDELNGMDRKCAMEEEGDIQYARSGLETVMRSNASHRNFDK